MKYLILVFAVFFGAGSLQAQAVADDVETLKKKVLQLDQRVGDIETNLALGEKKLRKGILVSTIGYTVTITGGMLLGRRQDELGKALLIAGGATGVAGTIIMVNAFRFFGNAKTRRP